jgi:hypothetical protein
LPLPAGDGPSGFVPRLPAPTLALKARDGRLLQPAPSRRPGIRPVSYKPITARVHRPVAAPGTGTAVPAGYVDAAHLAARLGVPEALIVHRATRSPASLPTHVLVDGRPYFDPTTLPGVPQ